MSDTEDNGDKPFEPTQRKLDDARKKGEVARSTDLFVTAAYGGMLLVAATSGAPLLQDLGGKLALFLDRPHDLTRLVFEGSGQDLLGDWSLQAALTLLPWFLAPAIAVIVMIVWQKVFVVTPSKLAFKPSRLSIIKNAKNKYGRSGLFEFAKSFAKLVIYSTCLAFFLMAKMPEIASAALLSPGQAVAEMLRLLVQFMILVLLVAAGIGGIDYMFQHAEFRRRNRMSLKEMKDEAKESEGDPYLKRERRQRAERIATNRMLQDVPSADVVVVNPTHYAVALKWSRLPGDAPECVAKGTDEIAARIREIAIEHAIPIRHDPPTARALHASVDIGKQIDAEHYKAVAAAIRFAEQMRKKARR